MAIVSLERTNASTAVRPAARRLAIGPLLLVSDVVAVGGLSFVRAPWTVGVTFSLVTLAIIASQGGYQRQFSASLERAIPRLFGALAGATVIVGLLYSDEATVDVIHRLPIILGAAVVCRGAVSTAVRWVNRRQARALPTLILGAGTTGVLLSSHLRQHREYGLNPVGFIDRVDDDDLPLPVLGDVPDLEQIIEHSGARQVIIAFGLVPEVELVSVIRRCQALDVDVWVIPRFFELGVGRQRGDGDEVWGIPLTRMPRLALRRTEWRVKRAFDFLAATFALTLLAPVILLVALVVKLSSPGPIFFRQIRIGQRGRTFELLKFRTMCVNDDSSTTWSVNSDERVTSVGRFLRRSCLDELPQFLNVLRGDMSLVGPRPERPHFVDIFRGSVRNYDERHRVPVGLTGLAQVNGLRGDTSIDERAVFDNNYIENWSLWSDVTIMVRTLIAMVRPPESVRTRAKRN